MNPPSALHSAMSRDRKPFTYTPGGLDLSEIKSERMAARLMRNAMNPGLPERPPQLKSPPTPSTPIAVPNFNCLPVQVFPTINLPANPKSMLRTRSIPGQPRECSIEPGPPPQFVNNQQPAPAQQTDTFSKNTPSYSQINDGRPLSMYEQGLTHTQPLMNYGSGGITAPFADISFDSTFKPVQPPSININKPIHNYMLPKDDTTSPSFHHVEPPVSVLDITDNNTNNVKAVINILPPETVTTKPVEEEDPSIEQKQVKIVTKQVKKESSVTETNGTQNGEAETEAVITLPSKQSGAKTETKVEVTSKTLPDGSVEEVKKTITKTTIDGRTEIKTKTETRIIPNDEPDDGEEEEVVEEEEEENGEVQAEEQESEETATTVVKLQAPVVKQNGDDNITKTEESSETTTTSTKRIVVVQDDKDEEEEEVEEEVEADVEAEPVTFVIKKAAEKPSTPQPEEYDEEDAKEVEKAKEIDEVKEEIIEEEKAEEIDEVKQEIIEEEKEQNIKEEVKPEEHEESQEEIEEEEQYEEAEDKVETKIEAKVEKEEVKDEEDVEEEPVKESKSEEVEEKSEAKPSENVDKKPPVSIEEENNIKTEVQEQQVDEEKQEVVNNEEIKVEKQEVKEIILTPKIEKDEPKFLREPSVPLEKVEDVEIKPISAGDFMTKSHTLSTEIVSPASGIITEYKRTETVETVNRTTEKLDPTPSIPSFFPHVETISPTPQAQRPYQPVYAPEPVPERRHSLLLERLSMERQLPTADIYQNTSSYSQTNEQQQQQQWAQEPRVEILEVNNVKPSSITNQKWYQQTKKDVSYNASTPSAQPAQPSWSQPQVQQQPQPLYSPKPQVQQQPQPLYSPQPQYQRQPSPQPQYHQLSPQPQYARQPSPQPQYQPSYSDNSQNTSSQQTMYTSYTSKPTSWTPSANDSSLQSNQYSSSYKDSSYSQQTTQQQYLSSYVPPPWEQDSNYVLNTPQDYYQPPPQTSTFSPTPSQGWKSNLPTSKFNKPPPTAYIPPKPNQSFVKPVTNVEPPKVSGRKTYYSEYERRYISVPESTYIPPSTAKFQAQPDPSPQYYYDNNEPTEEVEPQWRKELREFTEKTQTQTYTETSVKPPWESAIKPATKIPEASYTPTPTWSQTVRPQSWRERSFESEYVSQEWPKTNTLGRGRPLSSYGKESIIPERTRGVSVDRYNPNNYQSPAEHPPVQTYTHNPPAPHATGYHNPNVPAYHAARASAEPREQSSPYPQPRAWRQNQASPFQSRSFKYLQWITGTDD